jgi:3-oxoacyl-[acyl-carrier-protein] synthase II
VLTLQHQFVPPTINLEQPDEDCDLDYTPLRGRPATLDVALSVNFGFGGQNAAVVLGRPGSMMDARRSGT